MVFGGDVVVKLGRLPPDTSAVGGIRSWSASDAGEVNSWKSTFERLDVCDPSYGLISRLLGEVEHDEITFWIACVCEPESILAVVEPEATDGKSPTSGPDASRWLTS